MNSFRKLTEVAVISSAVTLVAVYIFVGTGGKLPGLNHENQNPTNGSNISSAVEKPPIMQSTIMPSSKVKVLDFGLNHQPHERTSPAPQAAPAPNQGPSQTIMLGPKSAPVFSPPVVNQSSPTVPLPNPLPGSPEDPKRKTLFSGSKALIPGPGSTITQQVEAAAPGYQPASSSTPNVPAPQPYTSAPNFPAASRGIFSGNQQPQPRPAQQQAVPQYKVQK